jgi:hypothetical protein
MNAVKKFASIALLCAVTSGCSMVGPTYQGSMDNVTALQKGGDFSAKVTEFKSEQQKGNENPISLRGNTMRSPYNDSFAAYLTEAVKQELVLANKYSEDSKVDISGELLQNTVDAAISRGTAKIEARFVVTNAGEVKYDQTKFAVHDWPSSFVGAVAIPRAIEEYQTVVSKLLNSLFSDQAFLNALK